MRIATNTLAVLCLIIGGVWLLQGINVLPGSFMTGQPRWAVYGALLCVAGIVVLVRGRRRHP